MNVKAPNMLTRAQGCLLGQLAGDALGSLVEFQPPNEIRRSYPDGVRELADGGAWPQGRRIVQANGNRHAWREAEEM